ncbi:hypothetical protein ABZZ79_34500 [Streptomyces sp. NPDC006458]|uniref:hypothetical protein n=1 Tax=Streptomyces sp. NPDC006458 TaxID=3154302 RepID=UPI0033A4119F
MARHDNSPNHAGRRALAALATAGVALGASATTAAAADTEPVVDAMRTRPTSLGQLDPQSGVEALTMSLRYTTGTVSSLKPNPLAGTGVDPLDNGIGTQLADFRPLTSQMLTAPVAQAESIGSIPLLGQATELLGG